MEKQTGGITSIFTSADIATLVANFQPVSFEDRPLLVRSKSGDSLVQFEKGLSKLEHLLEEGNDRLEKLKIPTLLGVQDGAEKAMYARLSKPLCESKDRRFLIPRSETSKVMKTMRRKATEGFVDLSTLATEQDITQESLRQLIDVSEWNDFREFDDGFRTFLCSSKVVESVKAEIRDAIGSSGTEICELPSVVADEVPFLPLKKLASEVVSDMGGEIRLEGDHINYVPANYSAAVEARLRQLRDDRITEFVHHLDRHGYCVVYPEVMEEFESAFGNDEDVAESVKRRFQKSSPHDMNLQTITVSDVPRKTTKTPQGLVETTVLVTPAALEQELNAMKSAVSCHAVSVWRQGERILNPGAVVKTLTPDAFSVARKSELAKMLFRSEYAREMEAVARRQLEDLEKEEQGKLAQLVEARLVIPLQLYTAGIDGITDATLKQHLEDFMADHFCREVIPYMVQAAREQKLLRAKEKEIEKFKQTCIETKTLADLQNAVAKLSRKLKLESPNADLVQKVKLRTLQTAVKSMQKMTRGSDVLQNLIWVLLAQQTQGMFMSSGKDTSRMIKLVEATGSSETAAMLVQWRDALKTGQETKDDLQRMRDMAKASVEAMVASERKSSVSSRSPEGRRKSSSATPTE